MTRREKCLETITVHLPETDHDAFAELALHKGLKPGVLAREIISEFVRRERERYLALASIFGNAE